MVHPLDLSVKFRIVQLHFDLHQDQLPQPEIYGFTDVNECHQVL